MVDYGLTIQFLEPESEKTEIRIGGKFHFQVNGKDWELCAETKPTELGPVFGIMAKTVKSALAFKDGRLEIDFAEGGKLTVMPDHAYEAWDVAGARWLRIVCLPGGGLETWQADPSESSGDKKH